MPCLEFRRVLLDRKSTRLNSSHTLISYAVFCLKKMDERGRGRGHGRDQRDVRGRRHRHPACHPRPLSFFLNDRATTEIYTLPLHAALPILADRGRTIRLPSNIAQRERQIAAATRP